MRDSLEWLRLQQEICRSDGSYIMSEYYKLAADEIERLREDLKIERIVSDQHCKDGTRWQKERDESRDEIKVLQGELVELKEWKEDYLDKAPGREE